MSKRQFTRYGQTCWLNKFSFKKIITLPYRPIRVMIAFVIDAALSAAAQFIAYTPGDTLGIVPVIMPLNIVA